MPERELTHRLFGPLFEGKKLNFRFSTIWNIVKITLSLSISLSLQEGLYFFVPFLLVFAIFCFLCQKYSDLKMELSRTERHILKEMGFICHVEHPHKFISNYLVTLGTPTELRQEAWNLANDRYFFDILFWIFDIEFVLLLGWKFSDIDLLEFTCIAMISVTEWDPFATSVFSFLLSFSYLSPHSLVRTEL